MGFDTQRRNTILGMARRPVAAFVAPMPSGIVELFGFHEVSRFHREPRRLLKVMLPLLRDFRLDVASHVGMLLVVLRHVGHVADETLLVLDKVVNLTLHGNDEFLLVILLLRRRNDVLEEIERWVHDERVHAVRDVEEIL